MPSSAALHARINAVVPWYARLCLRAAVLCACAAQALLRLSARLYRTRVVASDDDMRHTR